MKFIALFLIFGFLFPVLLIAENDNQTSLTDSNSSLIINDENSKIKKTTEILRKIHMIIAPVTFGAYLYNTISGFIMFGNLNSSSLPPYYNVFKIMHSVIAIYSVVSFTTTISLAFARLALKWKYGIPFKKNHMIAAFITSAMYIASLTSTIITGVKAIQKTDMNSIKPMLLSHGIINSAVDLSFVFNIITLKFGDYSVLKK